jgi:hypothetical protein
MINVKYLKIQTYFLINYKRISRYKHMNLYSMFKDSITI